jgi:hypothetical protein
MKEILEEELALVENYITFLDRRRTGGILYIPEELTGPEVDGFYGESEESLEEVLFEAMIRAAQDRQSVAAVIPVIVRGPAELHDKINYIDLDKEFYDSLCSRAYRIKAKIKELDNR